MRERCCKKILEVQKEFLEYCEEIERRNRRTTFLQMVLICIGTGLVTVLASVLIRFILSNILMG